MSADSFDRVVHETHQRFVCGPLGQFGQLSLRRDGVLTQLCLRLGHARRTFEQFEGFFYQGVFGNRAREQLPQAIRVGSFFAERVQDGQGMDALA